MTRHRRLIADALAAAEVVSSASHTWFGVRSQGLPFSTEQQMDAHGARAYLLHNLQMQLYADFYCPGGARPRIEDPVAMELPGSSPFVQKLSEANTGSGAREPGWVLLREEGDTLQVTRDRLTLWVSPRDVHIADPGSTVDGDPIANRSPIANGDPIANRAPIAADNRLTPGTPVCVLMPKELLRLSPGFYMALGDAEFPVDGSQPVVRLYWNLHSEGAAPLIELLTRRLNAERLAFRLKVASDPGGYARCDAGVLYTLREEHHRVSAVVANVYDEVSHLLDPPTPALTKRLAPGLGLAEEPSGQTMSFGMSRCRLLAEAIATAAEHGLRDPAQRLNAVEQRFAQEGIDLDAPYLNPGSSDRYRFPLSPSAAR